MAWTAPRTWEAAEIVTADMMNTHVRDNLNQLRSPAVEHYVRGGSDGDYSTTSSTPVNIDATNLSQTITTTGNDVLVTFNGYGTAPSGDFVSIFLDVDGTDQHIMDFRVGDAWPRPLGFALVVTGLTADDHTFTVQWSITGGGTAVITDSSVVFDVREIDGAAA